MASSASVTDEEIALISGQSVCRFNKFGGLWKIGASILVLFSVISVLAWSVSFSSYFILDVDIRLKEISCPVNFLAIGDWGRQGKYNQTLVAYQMGRIGEALDIDFVVSTGDNFYDHGLRGVDDPSFATSFSNVYTAPSLQKPWYSVLGNHDYHGNVLAQLDPRLTLRDPRWHCTRDSQLSFNLEKASIEAPAAYLELFFIDTTPFVDDYFNPNYSKPCDWRGLEPREEHLKAKLENLSKALEASHATWKIVVGHHTIRSFGNHGDTVEVVNRILPILEAHNVHMYLNGHDHCLEYIKRVDSKVHFVTSGGGSKAWKGIAPNANDNGLQFYYDGQGFTSISVGPHELHLIFYDITGSVIHRIHLSSLPKYQALLAFLR